MARGQTGASRGRGGPGLKDSAAAAGGVTSINGLTGAVLLSSPMLATVPAVANTVELDNGNVKTLADAATIIGIDALLHNSFLVETGAARTFSKPTGSYKDGEKITFTIKKTYTGATHHTFDPAEGGYDFASTLITVAGSGPRKAWFDDLWDAMLDGQWMKIGFEFIDDYGYWVCVAIAGPWPQTPE